MSEAADPKRARADDPGGPGDSLRRAREARGLKVEEAARALHLDTWIIEALEADDFEAIGAPVFAKGHLRQYGSMLGLATDDLMIAYYRVRGRHDAPPPPITATMARPEEGRGMFYIAAVVVAVVIVALAVLLWFVAGRAPVQITSSSTGAPVADAAPVAAVAAEPQLDTTPDRGATPASSAAPAVADETTPESPAVAAGATDTVTAPLADSAPQPPAPVRLEMRFGGESWVEVYDADGERLLYNMVGAGRTRRVEGRPPLEVYLGRSDGVTLAVDGEAFTIPASSVRGNTARFQVGAD